MAILEIRLYPDPVLREDCVEVTQFDDDLRSFAEDMIETVHAAPGVGLAAPQVGDTRRLAIIDTSVGKDPDALHVVVNPRLVEQDGADVDLEGCLSIPGLQEKVQRPYRVKVAAQDLDGNDIEIEAEEFEARAFCHEIDHLNGVLFVDHLRGLRKQSAKRKLQRIVRRNES